MCQCTDEEVQRTENILPLSVILFLLRLIDKRFNLPGGFSLGAVQLHHMLATNVDRTRSLTSSDAKPISDEQTREQQCLTGTGVFFSCVSVYPSLCLCVERMQKNINDNHCGCIPLIFLPFCLSPIRASRTTTVLGAMFLYPCIIRGRSFSSSSTMATTTASAIAAVATTTTTTTASTTTMRATARVGSSLYPRT